MPLRDFLTDAIDTGRWSSLTLSFWRHAKSDWTSADSEDHDRPLAARGQYAAPRMAAAIARRMTPPTCLLSSTATRARETAKHLHALWPTAPLIHDSALYTFSPHALEEALCEALSDAQTLPLPAPSQKPAPLSVLVVGHNPAFQELILSLLDPEGRRWQEDPRLFAISRKYPTAAFASLHADLLVGAPSGSEPPWRLLDFLRPKDLPAPRHP